MLGTHAALPVATTHTTAGMGAACPLNELQRLLTGLVKPLVLGDLPQVDITRCIKMYFKGFLRGAAHGFATVS